MVEICTQCGDGRLRGFPSANVIRLTKDGSVLAEGPVTTDGADVAHAAQLLDDLLPGFDAPPEYRAAGGMRLVIARALGTLDVPAFATLDEFCAALRRFAAPNVRAVARELFDAWSTARPSEGEQPQPALPATIEPLPDQTLTISDVRRARRATGVTLAEVSERSRIPAGLLRELEWGYLRNWPAGLYGRSQLVRYARAAGLDEELVVEIALPLLEEAIAARGGQLTHVVPAEQSIEALVPAGVQAVQVLPEPVITTLPFRTAAMRPTPETYEAARPRRRHWRRAIGAIAATVALALSPAIWDQFHPSDSRQGPALGDRETVPQAPARPARGPVSVARGLPQAQPRPHQTVPDGTLPSVKLTEPPARVTAQPAAYSPTFSNTGTAVFFHENTSGGSSLVRGETDDRGTMLKITRIVDDNAQNFHARPSPDGSRIAFDSDREGVRAVFVADADGQHVRRISGDGFAAVPSWSPDGDRLAFIKAEPDKPRVWNLWTADLNSGELHRVTSYPYGQPWGGSWFPDGDRIAYSHEEELIVLNLKTGATQVFKTPRAGHLVRTPAVSPDGRRIIFQVQRDGAWLLELRNGSMRRVLDDPSAEEYAWSPDGRRVAFHSHRAGGWGVWVMGQVD